MWRSAKCFNHVQQTPRFFPRFLKSKKSILIYLNINILKFRVCLGVNLSYIIFSSNLNSLRVVFFQQYSRIFSFPNFCPKTTKSRNPKGSRLIFSIMIEHLYQWQIQHFRWGGGLTFIYLAKFLPKTSWQWNKNLYWEGSACALNPLKSASVYYQNYPYRMYVLVITQFNNEHLFSPGNWCS